MRRAGRSHHRDGQDQRRGDGAAAAAQAAQGRNSAAHHRGAAAAAIAVQYRARARAANAEHQGQAGTEESRRHAPKPPDQPPKKQSSQDFAALLNKLTAAPKTPPNAKTGPRVVQGIGAANAMTADLADALKSQIYQCWSPPVGAPNANDLVVDFDLVLNADGTPASATSNALTSGNPYTRAAAEAARRAIAQCQPYKLPADRYSQWREINPLRFDPRQMMNQ